MDDDAIAYIVSMVPNERGIDWDLTSCMYGTEDRNPVQKFQEAMKENPELWNMASTIEGLITRAGVHAAGVIALNDEVYEHNSVMKTSSGARVTAFNLEDTEYAGGLKYDFLTINALDKVRTTLNLLLEDGVIEWKDTLRETYDHYLLPKNLDYDTEEMWDWVADGKIVDLFQFDTQVGGQAVRLIKPKNIAELSVANSVMRLMTDDMELPLNTYSRFKHDLNSWYIEMKNAGLTDQDIKLMEKHLLALSGVADSQESAMMLVMDPEISNFTVTEANDLRKAIAKKDPEIMEQTRQKFYHHGEEIGAAKNLLDYIWNVQIMRQAG